MLNRFLSMSLVITGAGIAAADDLVGANVLLCAPGYVMHCSSGGECELGPPENFDIPSFVRVDLERELLLTTESHEENRSSPIQFLTRANGEIYLQGDRGRTCLFAAHRRSDGRCVARDRERRRDRVGVRDLHGGLSVGRHSV